MIVDYVCIVSVATVLTGPICRDMATCAGVVVGRGII